MKIYHTGLTGLLLLLTAFCAQAFAPISTRGFNSNQTAIVGPINNDRPNGLYFDLGELRPSDLPNALDSLSDEKFSVFTESVAFNNASFETQAMDAYLAGLHDDTNGDFLGSNGGIDVSGLALNDGSIDPSLNVTHSRLLAWNPGPLSGDLSDSSDAVLGGVAMKDSKDMKEMAPEYTNPWHFFVRGNAIFAQGFSQPGLPHFDDNTESGVLGVDYRINPNFLVGLTTGYAHTDATLDDNGSKATVDSYTPGLYAAYADQGWYANLVGSYSHNAYTQNRNIPFLSETANSATQGNEGTVDLDGGYDFHVGPLKVGPLGGLQYTHLDVNSFSETGAPVGDLSVHAQSADSLRSRLGFDLNYVFDCHGTHIVPYLQAAWQHEFLDQSRGVTSSFNSLGGGDFSVQTPNPSRDSALVTAGVDADIDRSITVFADYQNQAGQSNYFGQSVQAGVRIGF
jgi:uncharacterized protein YhjY with autotransporter beta-barrel domain